MKNPLLVIALTLVGAPIFAQEMQPGQWEITLAMTTANAPGQNFGPYIKNYCISASDIANPTHLLGSVGATPSSCVYSNQKASGDTLNFDISCQGIFPLSGSGQTNWTSDTMSSTLELNAQIQNGPQLSTKVNISGRRIGGC